MSRRALVLVLLAAVATGCRARDVVATITCTPPADCDAGPPGDGGGGPDGATDGILSYCEGTGPAILVGDGITVGGSSGAAGPICSGAVAQRTFRFALCTCEDFQAPATLVTDSFDSSKGAYVSGGNAGSVGIGGGLTFGGLATVMGSLWVDGAAGIAAPTPTIDARLTVAGALLDQGGLDVPVPVSVAHDATIGGDVSVGDLTVGGTLTVPAGRTIAVTGTETVGATVRAPVSVTPPCSCGAADLVNVAGFIAAHETANDNASLGLNPQALVGYAPGTTLTLPCGRFYLDAVSGTGALTIRAAGRAVLLVGGDLETQGPFTVELADGGELDLMVGGILDAWDDVTIGADAAPARTRLYFAGAGQTNLSGNLRFAGNLYAPATVVAAAGAIEAYGSLFVRRLEAAAPVTVHYDTSVLQAAGSCPGPAPTTCTTCADCNNQACVGGACGDCTHDGDCCPPLTCYLGRCVPQIL
jgi:hypothetical protein